MLGSTPSPARAVFGVALAAVALLVGTACGSSGASSGATGISKPGDPKQAIADAVRRTTTFNDVKFDRTEVSTSKGKTTTIFTSVAATRNPPMLLTTGMDPASSPGESISNLAAGVTCISPAGGPMKRYAGGQPQTAAATDPFSNLTTRGSNWRFLDDVDLHGHRAWYLMGDIAGDSGANAQLTYQTDTVIVFIDSRSGKIEKVVSHVVSTDHGVVYDQTFTTNNVVYNSGVRIAPCQ